MTKTQCIAGSPLVDTPDCPNEATWIREPDEQPVCTKHKELIQIGETVVSLTRPYYRSSFRPISQPPRVVQLTLTRAQFELILHGLDIFGSTANQNLEGAKRAITDGVAILHRTFGDAPSTYNQWTDSLLRVAAAAWPDLAEDLNLPEKTNAQD